MSRIARCWDASTGAWFIGKFVSRKIPWAHLDIADMADGGPNDWSPAGSAGIAVILLEQFVRDWQPITRGAGEGGGQGLTVAPARSSAWSGQQPSFNGAADSGC